jgi:hypothetical protein
LRRWPVAIEHRGEGRKNESSRVVQFLRALPALGILVGASGFASLAIAQASHAGPLVVTATGALIPFGVFVLMVSVPLVIVFCAEPPDSGTDGDEGGGGGGRRPPDEPQGGPPWWPQFEEDLQRYIEEERRREPVTLG